MALHYIPVGVTTLQKDLIEILLQVHGPSLLKETIESSDALSKEQLMYLLHEDIRLVLNHPFLLVEHYIPKQFLLNEPKIQFTFQSDKFFQFDQILNSLIDLLSAGKVKPMNVLVVAQGIKELDLIEGFILGKHVHHKRYSGMTVFEPKKRNQSEEPVTPEYQSRRRRHKKKQEAEEVARHCVSLVSTTHLHNSGLSLISESPDLIISFDPLTQLPTNATVLNLLVEYSPDHYSMVKHCDKSEAVRFFLQQRDKLTTSSHDYNKMFLSNEFVTVAELPPLEEGWPLENQALQFETSSCKKIKLDEEIPTLTMHNYKATITKIIIQRLSQLEEYSKELKENLLRSRKLETERQNSFDELKAQISATFKQIKEMETAVNEAEKRDERAKDDLLKVKIQRDELVEYSKGLRGGDESLKKSPETLSLEMDKLRIELANIKAQNAANRTENEKLRTQYQEISSEAAQESAIASQTKQQLEQLKKKLEGPGRQLRYDFYDAQHTKNSQKTAELLQKKQFLTMVVDKMRIEATERAKKVPVGRSRGFRSST